MIAFKTKEEERYYREVEEFARKTSQLHQLRSQLWILHAFGERGEPRFDLQMKAGLDPACCSGTTYSRAWLFKDFAPYSFDVRLERRVEESIEGDRYEPWMQMGLIYHGQHDGFGSGSAPTLAVTLEPTQGWSIHS